MGGTFSEEYSSEYSSEKSHSLLLESSHRYLFDFDHFFERVIWGHISHSVSAQQICSEHRQMIQFRQNRD